MESFPSKIAEGIEESHYHVDINVLAVEGLTVKRLLCSDLNSNKSSPRPPNNSAVVVLCRSSVTFGATSPSSRLKRSRTNESLAAKIGQKHRYRAIWEESNTKISFETAMHCSLKGSKSDIESKASSCPDHREFELVVVLIDDEVAIPIATTNLSVAAEDKSEICDLPLHTDESGSCLVIPLSRITASNGLSQEEKIDDQQLYSSEKAEAIRAAYGVDSMDAILRAEVVVRKLSPAARKLNKIATEIRSNSIEMEMVEELSSDAISQELSLETTLQEQGIEESNDLPDHHAKSVSIDSELSAAQANSKHGHQPRSVISKAENESMATDWVSKDDLTLDDHVATEEAKEQVALAVTEEASKARAAAENVGAATEPDEQQSDAAAKETPEDLTAMQEDEPKQRKKKALFRSLLRKGSHATLMDSKPSQSRSNSNDNAADIRSTKDASADFKTFAVRSQSLPVNFKAENEPKTTDWVSKLQDDDLAQDDHAATKEAKEQVALVVTKETAKAVAATAAAAAQNGASAKELEEQRGDTAAKETPEDLKAMQEGEPKQRKKKALFGSLLRKGSHATLMDSKPSQSRSNGNDDDADIKSPKDASADSKLAATRSNSDSYEHGHQPLSVVSKAGKESKTRNRVSKVQEDDLAEDVHADIKEAKEQVALAVSKGASKATVAAENVGAAKEVEEQRGGISAKETPEDLKAMQEGEPKQRKKKALFGSLLQKGSHATLMDSKPSQSRSNGNDDDADIKSPQYASVDSKHFAARSQPLSIVSKAENESMATDWAVSEVQEDGLAQDVHAATKEAKEQVDSKLSQSRSNGNDDNAHVKSAHAVKSKVHLRGRARKANNSKSHDEGTRKVPRWFLKSKALQSDKRVTPKLSKRAVAPGIQGTPKLSERAVAPGIQGTSKLSELAVAGILGNPKLSKLAVAGIQSKCHNPPSSEPESNIKLLKADDSKGNQKMTQMTIVAQDPAKSLTTRTRANMTASTDTSNSTDSTQDKQTVSTISSTWSEKADEFFDMLIPISQDSLALCGAPTLFESVISSDATLVQRDYDDQPGASTIEVESLIRQDWRNEKYEFFDRVVCWNPTGGDLSRFAIPQADSWDDILRKDSLDAASLESADSRCFMSSHLSADQLNALSKPPTGMALTKKSQSSPLRSSDYDGLIKIEDTTIEKREEVKLDILGLTASKELDRFLESTTSEMGASNQNMSCAGSQAKDLAPETQHFSGKDEQSISSRVILHQDLNELVSLDPTMASHEIEVEIDTFKKAIRERKPAPLLSFLGHAKSRRRSTLAEF